MRSHRTEVRLTGPSDIHRRVAGLAPPPRGPLVSSSGAVAATSSNRSQAARTNAARRVPSAGLTPAKSADAGAFSAPKSVDAPPSFTSTTFGSPPMRRRTPRPNPPRRPPVASAVRRNIRPGRPFPESSPAWPTPATPVPLPALVLTSSRCRSAHPPRVDSLRSRRNTFGPGGPSGRGRTADGRTPPHRLQADASGRQDSRTDDGTRRSGSDGRHSGPGCSR